MSVRATLQQLWNANVPFWAWLMLFGVTLSAVRYSAGVGDRSGSPPDYTDDLKDDPPLGVRLGHAWSAGSQPTFLIIAQECACNPDILNPLLADVRGRVQVLVLLVASEEKAKQLRSRLDEGVRVLADPEFRVGKSLNACFLPRAYLVDTEGRLVWKQEDYKTTLRDAWKRASVHLSKEVRK